MLKAFGPVAILFFGTLAGIENPSWIQLFIVFMISVGVAISSYGELLFSLVGFLFQLVSTLCETSRLVLADKFLKDLKLDSLSVLYYMSPICFLFISIAFITFELDSMKIEMFEDKFLLGMLLLSGIAAFGLNIAVVMLISNASALILSLGGIIKDVLLIILSVLIFRSPVTGIQVFGYSISLFGMNLYKDYKKDPNGFTETIMSYLFCRKRTIVNIDTTKEETQNLLESPTNNENKENEDSSV